MTPDQFEEFQKRIVNILDKTGWDSTSRLIRDEYKVEVIIGVTENSRFFPVVINILFDIIGVSPESIRYFHDILIVYRDLTIEDTENLVYTSTLHYL